MKPTIKTLLPKKLIGKRLTMSFTQNRTPELWRSFMPCRNEISNTVDGNLYNIQLYHEGFFENFSPEADFEKWAAVEVSGFDTIPEGLEPFELPGGLYAVFIYKGTPERAAPFYRSIFRDWLPESGYVLDNRPHFEIMGPGYKHGDPDSEEEVWIPVR